MDKNVKRAFVALFIFVILFAGGLYVALNSTPATGSELPITTVTDIFIDVNGDGLQDYIRTADVIINSGNLTVSP